MQRDQAIAALVKVIGWNYQHPSGVYCQGCRMEFDGESILADLNEQGFDIVPRQETTNGQ